MKRMAGYVTGALAAAIVLSLTLDAAHSQTQPVVQARADVRDLGKRFDGDVLRATRTAYTHLQRQVGDGDIRVVTDIKYGPDALQAFDLFVPEQIPQTPAPIVVFLHGGGLTGGDKVSDGTDGRIYSNVARFFARNGMVGVNANYRLVPNVKWPGGPDDVRAMLVWLRENVAEYGGDVNQIFLMGNSAGATHVSAYLFHEPTQLDGSPGVIGALLGSGGFGPGSAETMSNYFGNNEAIWQANSPLGLLESYTGDSVPIFMWSAQYDPARIESRVAHMYASLCVKYEDCPRFTQFQGHNHVSPVMSIDSADATVGQAMLDFIDDVLENRAAEPH